MQRAEIIDAVAAERDDAAVVVSPGASSGLMYYATHPPHPATIYNMELGYTTAVAYGIALGRPGERVIAIEGDGSMFAGLQVLGTLARQPAANLTIVVLSNNIWGTGEADIATTPGSPAQLAALALACGLPAERVHTVEDVKTLRALLAQTKTVPGPWFLCAVTERSSGDRSGTRAKGRVLLDTVEAVDLTRRYLRDRR
jgi:sulfopyruvate decarboxylase subunit beta